ncbi:hypothetical protein BGZ83_004097, partial [Gryganskiella cystojenkinii]
VRAKTLATSIWTSVETCQLLQSTVYDIYMLAVEDIKNPERLRAQSLRNRASRASQEAPQSSSSAPERWELPEEYSDDFAANIIGTKTTIYALATFVFKGQSSGGSADQRIQNQAESRKSGRISKEKTTSDIPFYARWMFERFREETGFVPFEQCEIRTFDIEATREALAPVLLALQTHYQYAVFKDKDGEDLKWDAKTDPPAIKWFQALNKDGPFKDFVWTKYMRNFIHVTESDLLLFLKGKKHFTLPGQAPGSSEETEHVDTEDVEMEDADTLDQERTNANDATCSPDSDNSAVDPVWSLVQSVFGHKQDTLSQKRDFIKKNHGWLITRL